MSSSPPSERAPWRRGPAGWSLRTRLLIAVVALVAAVCAVLGVATTLAVYHLQVGQRAGRLHPAADRTRTATDPRHSSDPDDKQPHLAPLPQGAGTISTYVGDRDVHVEQVFDPAGGPAGSG